MKSEKLLNDISKFKLEKFISPEVVEYSFDKSNIKKLSIESFINIINSKNYFLNFDISLSLIKIKNHFIKMGFEKTVESFYDYSYKSKDISIKVSFSFEPEIGAYCLDFLETNINSITYSFKFKLGLIDSYKTTHILERDLTEIGASYKYTNNIIDSITYYYDDDRHPEVNTLRLFSIIEYPYNLVVKNEILQKFSIFEPVYIDDKSNVYRMTHILSDFEESKNELLFNDNSEARFGLTTFSKFFSEEEIGILNVLYLR